MAAAIEARKRRARNGGAGPPAQERAASTSPCRRAPEPEGRIHPISQTMDEIVAIFGEMGFTVAEGPDIEDDFHNFTALNIPPEHPARQMHDTFYLPAARRRRAACCCAPTPRRCRSAPCRSVRRRRLRIIAPGRTYRCDSDMTHTPMFHQVEGLVIDDARRIWAISRAAWSISAAPSSRSTTCRCASARATSPSPSRRPRSISAARARAAN